MKIVKRLYQFLFRPEISDLFIQSWLFGIAILIYRGKKINWNPILIQRNMIQHPKIKYMILEFIALQSFWSCCILFRYYVDQYNLKNQN